MARLRILALLGTLALLLAACGDDDGGSVRSEGGGSESGSASGSATGSETGDAGCEPVEGPEQVSATVEADLTEYAVIVTDPDPAEVPAGPIRFELHNVGAEPHELAIMLGQDDVPLDDDGAVDIDALPDGAFIGEVEAFPPGDCEGTFSLPAGSYVLFCNLVEVEDGEVESHYREGMYTELNVA